MASLAIATIVIGTAGIISSIAQASALRGQAKARQVEGQQELLSARRQLRQELGQAAVEVGASGLLGSSFANVFESQAIEDAEFLGRIKQRTDFDVANLKRQAKVTLITGLIGAGVFSAVGIAKARLNKAQLQAAERAASREAIARGARRNVFSPTSPAGLSGSRISTGATFF